MWNRETDLEKVVELQEARELKFARNDDDDDGYGKQPSIAPLLFIIGIICLVLWVIGYLTEGKGTTNSSHLNNQQSEYTKGSNSYEPNIPSEVERKLTGDWSSH